MVGALFPRFCDVYLNVYCAFPTFRAPKLREGFFGWGHITAQFTFGWHLTFTYMALPDWLKQFFVFTDVALPESGRKLFKVCCFGLRLSAIS